MVYCRNVLAGINYVKSGRFCFGEVQVSLAHLLVKPDLFPFKAIFLPVFCGKGYSFPGASESDFHGTVQEKCHVRLQSL